MSEKIKTKEEILTDKEIQDLEEEISSFLRGRNLKEDGEEEKAEKAVSSLRKIYDSNPQKCEKFINSVEPKIEEEDNFPNAWLFLETLSNCGWFLESPLGLRKAEFYKTISFFSSTGKTKYLVGQSQSEKMKNKESKLLTTIRKLETKGIKTPEDKLLLACIYRELGRFYFENYENNPTKLQGGIEYFKKAESYGANVDKDLGKLYLQLAKMTPSKLQPEYKEFLEEANNRFQKSQRDAAEAQECNIKDLVKSEEFMEVENLLKKIEKEIQKEVSPKGKGLLRQLKKALSSCGTPSDAVEPFKIKPVVKKNKERKQ